MSYIHLGPGNECPPLPELVKSDPLELPPDDDYRREDQAEQVHQHLLMGPMDSDEMRARGIRQAPGAVSRLRDRGVRVHTVMCKPDPKRPAIALYGLSRDLQQMHEIKAQYERRARIALLKPLNDAPVQS